MIPGVLFAALTVASTPGVDCAEQEELVLRLRAAGVVAREEDHVQVRFSFVDGKRVADIEVLGAAPRRIEHDGPDCGSLNDATVALLSVLLDELAAGPPSASTPAPPRVRPVAESEDAHRLFRAEAGALFSTGIVAPFGVGVALGFAWRPARWAALGVDVEAWPERDNAVRGGTVTVSASTFALVGCVGPTWRALTVEGCVLGHAGYYSLSAVDFPVVRPTTRALFGGEPAVRATLAVTKGFGIFARAGAWIPLTRLDVTARGTDAGFVTTSLGFKGSVGIELRL